MIIPGNATVILSAAQQLIKLGKRLDALSAERAAVGSDLVLRMPAVALPNLNRQCDLLKENLDQTEGRDPDPFGTDRAELRRQLALDQPEAEFGTLFAKYFPDEKGSVFNPDVAYLNSLQRAYPGENWRDPALRIAALAIAAGKGPNQTSYFARVSLAVADTILEFGAENTSLFVRDEKMQGVLHTVLERFAEPDWASFDKWNPLLQTALRVTLNSALDVGQQLPAKNPWLDTVLDLLVKTRAEAKQPEEFLLGLLQGKGVPLLLSQGLLVAADRLDDDHVSKFTPIAADLLKAVATHVADTTKPDIVHFFQDHWGDLLRAGLTSLDKHGDVILDSTDSILNTTLHALVGQLAETPDAKFFTNETLHDLADTVIGVVAAHPDQIPGLENKKWLKDLISAAANTAKQLTSKRLFTAEAADALLRDAIGVVGKNPGLLVKGNGLPVTIVSSVFEAVSVLPKLDARMIGETAARSALTAIANDASLAEKELGPVVTEVAKTLASYVGAGKFTTEQAKGLASAAIDAIARNPQIYAGAQEGIAKAVISAVEAAFSGKAELSRLLVQTANQTLAAVGRNGADVTSQEPLDKFEKLLTTILSGGLAAAEAQIGVTTDLDGIPAILGGIVAKAMKGDLKLSDLDSDKLKEAFEEIAAKLQTA